MSKRQTQPKPAEAWEFEKVLVASTGHVTEQDDIIISRANISWIDKTDAGYRVLVCEEMLDDELEVLKWGFSMAFWNLMRKARELGCEWLRIDRDGPLYADLHQFTW